MADTLGQVPYAATRNPFNYTKVEQIARDLTTNWLTLDEITNQLNLFGDESQDSYLEGLEVAVRMHIEDYLGMSIFPTSYRVYYNVSSIYASPVCLDLPEASYKDSFNSGGVTINKVAYYNGDSPSVLITLAPTTYYYDVTGNKVICNGIPNEVNQNITNPIVVQYTTGASPYAQYPVIKQAGLLMLTHLYNNRSDTTVGQLSKLPFGVEQLLRPYKPLVL